ncbi:SAV_915 family protein [Streptomyces sp. NPDC058417]|uniref:SAV_915 family protein n=1 Tax=unclassified Streptomyces TaxID=2593676 RepID=UPI00366A508A
MAAPLCGDDPEPCERTPAGPLYVPVRPGPAGNVTRLFRTPLGARTAVGFTSAGRLTATLGTGQPWIRLAEPALRALTAPLGVTTVTVDPPLSAPAPAPSAPTPSAPAPAQSAPSAPASAAKRPAPAPDRTAGPAPVPALVSRIG